MDPLSMEKAMLQNMVEKTGRPINEWIQIVKDKELEKHSEKVKYFKEQYSLTHRYANLISQKSK